jgi:DNA-binding XRE family transcriptional regulator
MPGELFILVFFEEETKMQMDNTTYRKKMSATNKIGVRLRWARLKEGYSQEKLAKVVGSTQKTISQYERGERGRKRPDIYLIKRLAKALKVKPWWLLWG